MFCFSINGWGCRWLLPVWIILSVNCVWKIQQLNTLTQSVTSSISVRLLSQCLIKMITVAYTSACVNSTFTWSLSSLHLLTSFVPKHITTLLTMLFVFSNFEIALSMHWSMLFRVAPDIDAFRDCMSAPTCSFCKQEGHIRRDCELYDTDQAHRNFGSYALEIIEGRKTTEQDAQSLLPCWFLSTCVGWVVGLFTV
jgi:hypothetical protein